MRDDGSAFGAERVHLGPLSHAIAGFATTGLVLAEGLSRPRLASATLQRDARLLAGTRSYLALGADEIGGHTVDRHVVARPPLAHAGDLGLVVAGDVGLAVADSDGFEEA